MASGREWLECLVASQFVASHLASGSNRPLCISERICRCSWIHGAASARLPPFARRARRASSGLQLSCAANLDAGLWLGLLSMIRKPMRWNNQVNECKVTGPMPFMNARIQRFIWYLGNNFMGVFQSIWVKHTWGLKLRS